jgi:protein-disulfide isomerase/uncharacterized membrane protein
VRESPWLSIVRLASVIALASSTALLLDYVTPTPAFCGAGSGCEAVRRSGYGYFLLGGLPIPVPVFGLIGFSALFGASLVQSDKLRRNLVLGLASLGGLVGLGLLGLQLFGIGAMCSLCVVTDAAAIVAAGVAPLAFLRQGDEAAKNPLALRSWAWLGLAALAALAPIAWMKVRPLPPVPPQVLKLYAPGKINVVEFADYQCPFCRMLHGRLKTLIESYPGKVNFVRLNLPLDSHEHARGAAFAAVCADEQGKGEPMADLLFSADDLTAEGNRASASKLGLDLATFDRCVDAKSTAARVERESAILRNAGLKGLPTTYVGDEEIVGAQSEETFRDAFERAARGEGNKGVSGAVFLALVAVLAGALVRFGRPSYNSTWEPAPTKKAEQSKSPST